MKHCIFLLALLFNQALTNQYCSLGNDPVCGSDNVTYANRCELNKSFATLKDFGACPTIQSPTDPTKMVANCTYDFTPVCGVDGITYGNECRMKYAGMEKAYDGVCGVENYDPTIFQGKVCVCSYEWHPVCTRNSNVNFENSCLIRCIHQLEGSYDSCKSPCNCALDYNPVCSSKGLTFDNECQLNCAGAIKSQNGECESILYDCDAGCSKTFAPVCGADGNTYRNTCFANCKNVKVAKSGLCDKDSKNPALKSNGSASASQKSIAAICQRCSREIRIAPVCAEDGTTYENECQCQCQNGGVCPKYADGPCPNRSVLQDNCSQCKNYPMQPVCGNNFRTYDNLCYLQCNKVALYKRGNCDSFGVQPSATFDMRTSAFNQRVQAPPAPPAKDQLVKQAQTLLAQVSQAQAANQQVSPALINAIMSVIEAIQQLK